MRLSMTFILLFWSLQASGIDLDAETDFAQVLSLNSSISSRVASIDVRVGQRVDAGQLLLTLDSTALQASADIARGKVNSLAPRVAKMRTELEKSQELFDRDSLALVALQNAEQEFAIAEANLSSAQAGLAQALHLLSQAQLYSPIDGVVLAIETFAGRYINTRVSDPVLIVVADDRSMIARALLPLELNRKHLLDRSVEVSYGDKRYTGEIVEAGKRVTAGDNNHPAIEIKVNFDAGGEVPANLSVRISIKD